MKQTAGKRKPIPKRRRAAPRRKAVISANESEAALAALMALLHADRWLFEAVELAKKGDLASETKEFDRIRLAIVASLQRLQPRAYGAMARSGYFAGGY